MGFQGNNANGPRGDVDGLSGSIELSITVGIRLSCAWALGIFWMSCSFFPKVGEGNKNAVQLRGL
jgi:hypothetical protein